MKASKETHQYLQAESGEHVTDGGSCWCKPAMTKLSDGSLLYVHNRRDKPETKATAP